jgi:hypothetical protein
MKKILLATVMLAAMIPLAAQAQSNKKVEPARYDEIAEFCEGKAKPPKKGIQWNGEGADPAVMLFRAGDYELNFKRGIWLWLYHDGSFFLNLSKHSGLSFGSDGEDWIQGRRIGGCSREQLSEILKKNEILDMAKAMVPEDILLKQEKAEEEMNANNPNANKKEEPRPSETEQKIETDEAGIPKRILH